MSFLDNLFGRDQDPGVVPLNPMTGFGQTSMTPEEEARLRAVLEGRRYPPDEVEMILALPRGTREAVLQQVLNAPPRQEEVEEDRVGPLTEGIIGTGRYTPEQLAPLDAEGLESIYEDILTEEPSEPSRRPALEEQLLATGEFTPEELAAFDDGTLESLYEDIVTASPDEPDRRPTLIQQIARTGRYTSEQLEGFDEGTLEDIYQDILTEDPETEGPGFDRDVALGLIPELGDYAAGLSDTTIQSLARSRAEKLMTGGPVEYRNREGSPQLSIVKDEAFERSGLKSGDVVCIRIP